MSPNAHPSLAIVAAASSSSFPAPATSATPVIIGVTVSVGSVILLVVAFRIWNCTRPPKAPLPPKGPLAHDRQRHAAASFAQPAPQSSFPIRAQGFMHMPLSNNASYPGHTRQASSRTEIASIPPSSPSIVSSQAHLVSESDENADVRGRQPSLGYPANARHHHRGYRSRTVSNTGSVRSTRSRQSSLGTIRGPPHHHHVNIVLPQPLAPGLYNSNNTFWQPPFPRAPTREKRSESCDREYRSRRVSTDGSSSSTHETVARTPLHHESAAHASPVPQNPRTYPHTPSTPRPHVSNAASPSVSHPWSPNVSVPLLAELSPPPTPDDGPPPVPPKDPPRYPSRRPRRHSDSAGGRVRR